MPVLKFVPLLLCRCLIVPLVIMLVATLPFAEVTWAQTPSAGTVTQSTGPVTTPSVLGKTCRQCESDRQACLGKCPTTGRDGLQCVNGCNAGSCVVGTDCR